MPTYAGISFEVEAGGDGFTRTWGRESRVARQPIPWGNRDVVQYGGKGNYRWSGQINLDSHADYVALEAVSGDAEGRQLNDFMGETISNVRLNSISQPEQDPIDDWHRCQVEFEYAV